MALMSIAASLTMMAEKSEVRIPRWDRFVEITGENVNLRMGPGMEGEKLAGEYFAKGEVAPLLDDTDDWAKVYYVYSPTQYVWLSKQFTREVSPQPLPKEYRFTTYLTYGDQMLTYVFDGKPTNIVYSGDYPFSTTTTWADEPDLYHNDGRFESIEDTNIDWATVMPQIRKTIPDKCVYEYFRGVPLNGHSYDFRTDPETTVSGPKIYFDIYQGDAYYTLTIYALPTHKADELMLIALSASGLDGTTVKLLKTMRYNIKTGQYSDIRNDLPGVVTDKLGLNYDLFKDISECQREARQSATRHINITTFCGIPMVTVTGESVYYSYPINPDEIEDFAEKTTVYYLWDGDKFVKMVRSPYIDKAIEDGYRE